MANTTLHNVANTAITGSGLIVTATAAAAYALSADTYARSSGGKYYFEATINVFTDASLDCAVGVGSSNSSYSTNGAGALACYYAYSNGTIYNNGGSTGITVGGALGAGDVLCVAVDLSSNLIWFRKNGGNWNNSGTANPATATGGVAISTAFTSVAPCVNLNKTADQVTLNFGGTTFAQTAPAGFGNWRVVTPPAVGTVWNPADSLNVGLTAPGLIATPTGQGLVRTVDSLTTGKYYFEVAMAGANAGGCVIGVCTRFGSLSTLVTTGLASAILNGQGTVNVNGVNMGTSLLGASVSGQPFCIAVDLGAMLIWFRNGASGNWNGSATANPATGVGGFYLGPLSVNAAMGLFACCGATGANVSMTANFGNSAFVGAVPSGFTSGFPTDLGPTVTSALSTQTSVEQFIAPNPAAWVTQVGVEHFVRINPYLQMTQIGVEEWALPNANLQVTQIALEEWATVKVYVTIPVLGAGEVDASADVEGQGATLSVAAGAGEVDATATATGTGALAISGTGEVDAGATVTGTGGVITAVAGTGEADAAADVEGAGFQAAIGTGEVDAFADVRGMGAVLRPPGALPFLPGLGWSVHRRPTFNTIVAPHPSGAEVRLALWQNCLWEFELSYDALASNDAYPGAWTDSFQTLMGFYLARGGQHGTFLFIDPDFNAMAGQGIGAGDGTTIVFPVYRVFGGQVEPVSWVTAVAAIYLDGVAQPSGWTVSGNTVTFAAAPASGVVISADFSYGFRCRFLEDTLDFEEFMDNLWQLKSLKFRQVRL